METYSQVSSCTLTDLQMIRNGKSTKDVMRIFLFDIDPDLKLVHLFVALTWPVLNRFMLRTTMCKARRRTCLVLTFPSSNSLVTMTMLSMRNCQIIRRKSRRVASVGARAFSKHDQFMSPPLNRRTNERTNLVQLCTLFWLQIRRCRRH